MGGQEEVEDEGIDKMVQGRREEREEMSDDATAAGEGGEMEPWRPTRMDKSYVSKRFQFQICTSVLTAALFICCARGQGLG